MKSAGKARNDGLYRHIRTSKEIIRNLLNDSNKDSPFSFPMMYHQAAPCGWKQFQTATMALRGR